MGAPPPPPPSPFHSIDSEKPTVIRSSKICTIQHDTRRSVLFLNGCPHCRGIIGFVQARNGFAASSQWVPDMQLCTLLLHFPLSDAIFLKNMSFATITKPWSHCHRTNKNSVHTGTWCPFLCPSTRSRPCTRAPAPCPNSSVGMLQKKGVFTLVPSEYRTWAPCPGTKCEGCLTFPRTTKEIGHARLPARRLFVPLMSNSDFHKTEQLFVSA